ncbi:S41 family peptidase [uncultured Porphyromonas sp.]|uniref:S41 family peptidase n=2 Tax=environmental samples TaxID=134245 RepID=UPI00259B1A05|nr:S41 family peptidase [uncultured Porphyromonas sp.]
MTIKKLLLVGATSLLALSALAQSHEPRWVRQTALSPDGKEIAFTYMGDLYTVPVSGGLARQITSHPAYDQAPVWSKDGQKLAFASDREGNFNVYITSRIGGNATRVTLGSTRQIPVAFLDDETILFDSYIRPAKEMGLFPSGMFTQLYQQKISGSRPKMFSAITMIEPSIGADGRILYTDLKGYEDKFRKHHTSSVTRDIWLYNPTDNKHQKLTTFKGEDRNALWLPGQREYLYTSEADGTLNIYKGSLEGKAPVQLTHFEKHPVRYMSMDGRGNVAFSWNGELYYMPLGGEPTKVALQVVADYSKPEVEYRTITRGATDYALSPNEKEVAFIVRGDVFVTNIEYGTTRRITNTPEQERDLTWSPDGRKLVYSAERGGQWNLYMTELAREADKEFVYAKEFKETQLTNNTELPSFQPEFSPDGKEIAFLRDRSAIYVLNLASKAEREVMNKKYQYSYSDGDQDFAWSPDSKWIITEYIGIGGWNNKDVAIIKADGSGTTHNLTESGYSEGAGRFVLNGKGIIFASDRAGYRSHGSWGAEYDLYLMFLDQEAYDAFILDKEEREKLLPKKEEKDDDKKEDKKGKKDKKAKEETKVVAPLTFDLAQRDYRTVRLTRTSGFQSDFAMNPKGDKLYYLAYFDDATNLYEMDLAEKKTEMLLADVGNGLLEMGKDGKTLYLFSGKGMYKIEGKSKTPITFAAKFEYRGAKEREYMFDHVVKQVANKFYDKDLHGVDWQGYADNYRAFLPEINNNYDYAEMLSELLGELNASHTGARYGGRPANRSTASLGLFYDDSYEGVGVKIAEVIPGGPMDKAKSIAKPGVIITKVNGEEIAPDKPIEYYINGHTGEWITLTLKGTDQKEVEEQVRPTARWEESELLYRRWVEQRAKMVEEWSGGKIAYVHVEGMDSPSFRKTFKDLLGKYRHCDAVIIDTRFNGGGWLHEDLVTLLTGKLYSKFAPRGQFIGNDPFAQWTKPSAVLMSEGNYSNAHGFPWVYKTLGIGKLIGAPVPGTMTAVWWETLVDPSLVFGIPQVTVTDVNGNALENHQLEPDILIYNTPEEAQRNYDAQLKAAVDELMKK